MCSLSVGNGRQVDFMTRGRLPLVLERGRHGDLGGGAVVFVLVDHGPSQPGEALASVGDAGLGPGPSARSGGANLQKKQSS